MYIRMGKMQHFDPDAHVRVCALVLLCFAPCVMTAAGPKMLEVKQSSIPGAGKGLFARERIAVGAVVCEYTGRQLRTLEALR